MKISFDPDGSVQGFERIISGITHDGSVKALLIFSCDDNGFSIQDIDPIIKNVHLPLIGGIFPAIFCNGKAYEPPFFWINRTYKKRARYKARCFKGSPTLE